MKTSIEYLNLARAFEATAAHAQNPIVRHQLQTLARSYFTLAESARLLEYTIRPLET
jgi:hypothetical protein